MLSGSLFLGSGKFILKIFGRRMTLVLNMCILFSCHHFLNDNNYSHKNYLVLGDIVI